jgi:mannose-6-phosphate isomerase-like protein (cupin superfamily)
MGIGQAVYEDERYPQFFVFAKEGAEHLKPWMAEAGAQVADGAAPQQNLASRLYAESVGFALAEEARRQQSRVLVRAEEITFEPTPMGDLAYVIDPRIGFNTKAIATLLARVPPGKRSGAHRHLYDEIDYVLEGEGTVIVDDVSYEVGQGDVLAIPVFAWHQYFATGDVPLKLLCHNTRPAMENLGLMLLQQGELADY